MSTSTVPIVQNIYKSIIFLFLYVLVSSPAEGRIGKVMVTQKEKERNSHV